MEFLREAKIFGGTEFSLAGIAPRPPRRQRPRPGILYPDTPRYAGSLYMNADGNAEIPPLVFQQWHSFLFGRARLRKTTRRHISLGKQFIKDFDVEIRVRHAFDHAPEAWRSRPQ